MNILPNRVYVSLGHQREAHSLVDGKVQVRKYSGSMGMRLRKLCFENFGTGTKTWEIANKTLVGCGRDEVKVFTNPVIDRGQSESLVWGR